MPRLHRSPLMLVPPAPERDSERPGPAADDSVLIAGLKARDPSLSGAFYDRVRPIIDRSLMRLLGVRDHEYEDVAQRTLHDLVDGIDSFRGDCPLNAWISIVTGRIVFRTIRRRRLERRIFSDVELGDTFVAPGSIVGTLAARQALERLRGELEQMDYDRAWTFLLHDVHGYNLKEIGEITGVSLSAAQSRLVRGRREIHEHIRNDQVLARFLRQPEGSE
jgi:RNA polymerase sigma-70 factor (ECF subfamily)